MFGLGVPEILVIALIILLLFGAKRLPSIGAGLGQTVKEIGKIKKELRGDKKSDNKAETGKESEPDSKPIDDNMVDALERKVTDKVLEQVPGIKQAKQIKDKADKIKKIVT